ncbi:hypothetical protein [Flavihumibacter solisilvae]|uniref:Uncharacterized protein n=1 Tax=Flavihumibacter solisilvae TaxID=1349421 RepID=A0A0C1L5U5_9BACT|nr:hypothetical protein [Flavihumibacter solisilvae]KIC95477.1 hypothetical protein OI18_06250 [Flavihumibacter solisilvae]
MNKRNFDEKELIDLLKETGLDTPDPGFSQRLSQMVVHSCRRNTVVETRTEKWLGKIILGVLVIFNLAFFYYLSPFSVDAVLFTATAAFVAGLWILIVLVKKLLAGSGSKFEP